jgi:hypothetical protein
VSVFVGQDWACALKLAAASAAAATRDLRTVFMGVSPMSWDVRRG